MNQGSVLRRLAPFSRNFSQQIFPYGIASWKDIKTSGMFYADKTHFIKELEDAGRFLKSFRSRRMGKSVFCDMLDLYYDKANSSEDVRSLLIFVFA